MSEAKANTDRVLWRDEKAHDGATIFLTEGDGLGISVAGLTHVRPVREWHLLMEMSSRQAIAQHQQRKRGLEERIAALERRCDENGIYE